MTDVRGPLDTKFPPVDTVNWGLKYCHLVQYVQYVLYQSRPVSEKELSDEYKSDAHVVEDYGVRFCFNTD